MTVDETRVEDPAPSPVERSTDRRAGLRPLVWRLHFLSGFLAAPIVLSLAVTGILFAWHPQIEAALHHETLTAVAEGPARPLGEQVEAARRVHPGWSVEAVTPAAPKAGGEQTTAVTLSPPVTDSPEFGLASGASSVYVDPASATVTGEITEANRPSEWLRNLHSSWRLGPVAEPLTELAASWVLVSLLSGLVLWWPRNRRLLARAFRFRRPGRPRWRSLHTTLGVGISVALLVIIGSGLSWTNFAGAWIDVARAQLGSTTPEVSTALTAGTAAVGTGHGQHHGSDGAARPVPADLTAGIDRVQASATAAGMTGVLEFEPPAAAGQAWTVSTVDNRWPIDATSVAVDPATGAVTDRVGWADYPLLAKATTLGITFHQAEMFGLNNQIALTAMAIALIVVIIAGYRMWWLRRPAGGLGIPPRVGPLLRTVPVPLLLGFVILMVLLPTLGVSFLIYLAVERMTRAMRTRPRAASQ